jgi:hypothetical protein
MRTRATKMMMAEPADSASKRVGSNKTPGVLVGPVVEVGSVVVSVTLEVSMGAVVVVVSVGLVVPVVDVVVVVVVGISVSLSGLPR